jgi:hypothetical protein
MSDGKFKKNYQAFGRNWSTKDDDADLDKQSLWKRELDFKYDVKRREGEADSRISDFSSH